MKTKTGDASRPGRTGKFIKVVTAILGGCLILLIAVYSLLCFGDALLKQDSANSMGNLRKIYNRLENYKAEHGSYPEQQDMRALLQTLGMSDNDLAKVYLFDIDSAEYQAPLQDSEDPVLTMRVRWRLLSKSITIVILKDGMEYEEN